MGVDTFGLSFWLCVFLRSSPRRARRCSSACPRCGCAPTTSPSSRSPPARSSASCSGRPGSARPPAARPASRTSPATSSTSTRSRAAASTLDIPGTDVGVDVHRQPALGAARGLVARRASPASSCTCSCAARGAGCSRRSARTRTPSAASARTSTSTSSSRSSSAASSARSAASCSPSSRQSVVPDSLGTALTFFAYVALVLGGAARVLGPVVGSMVFFFLTPFVDVALREAIEADVHQLPRGQRGRHRAQHPRGPRPDGAHDLPTPGHHRRQAGGGGQCPALSPRDVDRRAAFEGLAPSRAWPSPTRSSWPTACAARFGGLTAVDVDHLEVQRGAITALIGPNGAGKTTFFNLLTGFDQPDAGRWTLRRRATWPASPAHKVARTGMVRTFQLTKSLARLSVLENMKLGATGQRGEGFFAGLVRPLWTRPGGARSRPGPRSCSRGSSSTTCATSSPARCRAASASCSRWPGR